MTHPTSTPILSLQDMYRHLQRLVETRLWLKVLIGMASGWACPSTVPSSFAAIMSEQSIPCPECRSAITYPTGTSLMCAECGHEWNPEELLAETASAGIKDANGNLLQNGDDVVVIKDPPVKGLLKPVKAGTKVKNIRLVDGDHESIAASKASGPWASRASTCARPEWCR